ncbi:MAG TPA: glycosyltransferase family 2 protein, partial [Chloroflexota bacterium]|nr:glycosyltransferase family 2 protein [Chloroflexota bacterium]
THPRVTIVVVTHGGRVHLERCLTALQSLKYPADRYQTVVVNNAPDSQITIAERFPGVSVLNTPKDLGFAAANDLGFAKAPADFYVCLNDDTAATPGWLTALLQPALDDASIGLCTGKLILMHDRLRVRLRCPDPGSGSLDLPRSAWRDGEPIVVERLGPRSTTYVELGVPIEPGTRHKELRFALDLAAGTGIEAALGDELPRPVQIGSGGTLNLAVEPNVAIRSVVQNAGSIVFRDGRGRDRGAVAGRGFHYYEDDVGQFERTEEVFAGCGASLLIRSSTLADVGGFDERFFAYYEDIDLSWRSRLRGWRVVYAPRAVVRHVHRGTSRDWTWKFGYYTERNRLMMLVKLATPDVVLTELARAVATAGLASAAAAGRVAT